MIKLRDNTTFLVPTKFYLEFRVIIRNKKEYNTYSEINGVVQYKNIKMKIRHSVKQDIRSDNLIFWRTLEVDFGESLIVMDNFIREIKKHTIDLLKLHEKSNYKIIY
jgi:hypothetical protein